MIIPRKRWQPCKVEPWAISPTGEVVRVVVHREYLNPRQERFALEYLKDGNGTKAAIRAGYAASSAAVQASRLLNTETVVDKIRALQNGVQQRNEDTLDKTLRELCAIAFADPLPLFDRKWNLLPPNKIPKDARRAFDGLEFQKSVKGGVRTVKVRFANKLAALKILGKGFGMFPKPPKA